MAVGEPDPPATELLAGAREDREAFAAVCRAHTRAVWGFLYHHTRSVHAADELTAETFAQALAAFARYDSGGGGERAWLFGIARNVHRQALRQESRRQRLFERMAARPQNPVVEWAQPDLGRDVREPALGTALAALTPAMRSAIVLRVGHDLRYADVADRLGCREATVRVRVCRALTLLRMALAQPVTTVRPEPAWPPTGSRAGVGVDPVDVAG